MPPAHHPFPAPPAPGFIFPRAPLAAVALFALVALLLAPSALHAATAKEHQLKAGFLYNFAKFVEWPADKLDDADAGPLVIAVLADEAFNRELTKAVRDRFVKKHPVVVRRLLEADDLADVHLLFVGAGGEPELADSIRGRPGLLTVGESAEFARLGGVITFVLVDDKVRFEINQAAGEAAGLKLSAQLLKLALPARPRP